MVKKRGPGRPPLSAAEKARRKAEREALKASASAAPKRRGRKPGTKIEKTVGRRPGRPKGQPSKFVRRDQTGESFPLLVAEMAERTLKLEKMAEQMSCTQNLADRLATLEAQIVEYAKALGTVTEAAAATETKLGALCDSLNNYFGQVNMLTNPESQPASEPAAVVNQ